MDLVFLKEFCDEFIKKHQKLKSNVIDIFEYAEMCINDFGEKPSRHVRSAIDEVERLVD